MRPCGLLCHECRDNDGVEMPPLRVTDCYSRHTDRFGHIKHRAHACELIVLEVIDTGTGIPESILPGIFDLFCTTKGSRGTGFGLAVTKKIVEEHGGRLEVETVVGSGTTIRVLLPR